MTSSWHASIFAMLRGSAKSCTDIPVVRLVHNSGITDRRFCVVGTGALGSALLDRLRAHGVPSVLLVDPDTVEARNLPLSPLLRRAVAHFGADACQSSGKDDSKADLLARAARTLDGLPWRSAACEIANVGWADLTDVDLICCCTDSVLSRIETTWIARALQIPMLDGAVFGQGIAGGRVTAFPAARDVACFLCGLPEDRRAAVLGYAASASLGCQAPEDLSAMEAALATLDAVAGTMLAHILCWQELAGDSSWSTRLAERQDGTWQAEPIQLTRSASCPWHAGFTGALEPLPYDAPLAPALRGDARELVLNWPVCTEAVCEACGVRSRPLQRVALVRRSLCQTCGHPQQQPLRTIHRIRPGDPYSSYTPRQLGMPPRHLYWFHEADMAAAGVMR